MMTMLGAITYEYPRVAAPKGQRTAEIPATEFTATHEPLMAALLGYNFLPRAAHYNPQALYTIVEELAAGRALTDPAITATEQLLEISADQRYPDNYPFEVDGFCASCFCLLRSEDDWRESDPDEVIEDGVTYRWARYRGTDICARCCDAPGNMAGVTVAPAGVHALLGPVNSFSNRPRYTYHPSEWPTQGYAPDERGPVSPPR